MSKWFFLLLLLLFIYFFFRKNSAKIVISAIYHQLISISQTFNVDAFLEQCLVVSSVRGWSSRLTVWRQLWWTASQTSRMETCQKTKPLKRKRVNSPHRSDYQVSKRELLLLFTRPFVSKSPNAFRKETDVIEIKNHLRKIILRSKYKLFNLCAVLKIT